MPAVVVEPNGATQSSDSDATDKDFEVQSWGPREPPKPVDFETTSMGMADGHLRKQETLGI